MVKKKFTDELLTKWNDLSDVELVELLAKGTFSHNRIDAIKALLDGRLKKVLNHLKEITEKNILAQEKYSAELVGLTSVLVKLTKVLVILTIVIAGATVILLLR